MAATTEAEIGNYHSWVDSFRIATAELHGKYLVAHIRYPDFEIADLSGDNYPQARLPETTEFRQIASYKGRTACNKSDEAKSCALLIYQSRGTNPPSKSKSDTAIDLIVEPHTLLPHSIKMQVTREIFSADADQPESETEVSIDILIEY